MLNVQQKTVSEWESGLYEPDIETLGRIAKAARSSVGWLVAGESPEGVEDGIRKTLIAVRAVVDEMLTDLRNNREKLFAELATAVTVERAEDTLPALEETEISSQRSQTRQRRAKGADRAG